MGGSIDEDQNSQAPESGRLARRRAEAPAGRVVSIANEAEFTPRAALTEEEQANLVFGVKLALGRSQGALKAGMPADARITPAK